MNVPGGAASSGRSREVGIGADTDDQGVEPRQAGTLLAPVHDRIFHRATMAFPSTPGAKLTFQTVLGGMARRTRLTFRYEGVGGEIVTLSA